MAAAWAVLGVVTNTDDNDDDDDDDDGGGGGGGGNICAFTDVSFVAPRVASPKARHGNNKQETRPSSVSFSIVAFKFPFVFPD